MLSYEINDVFSQINSLACLKLSPECNGNEKAMELLNRGKVSFDSLQKVLSEIAESDNQAIAETPP